MARCEMNLRERSDVDRRRRSDETSLDDDRRRRRDEKSLDVDRRRRRLRGPPGRADRESLVDLAADSTSSDDDHRPLTAALALVVGGGATPAGAVAVVVVGVVRRAAPEARVLDVDLLERLGRAAGRTRRARRHASTQATTAPPRPPPSASLIAGVLVTAGHYVAVVCRRGEDSRWRVDTFDSLRRGGAWTRGEDEVYGAVAGWLPDPVERGDAAADGPPRQTDRRSCALWACASLAAALGGLALPRTKAECRAYLAGV